MKLPNMAKTFRLVAEHGRKGFYEVLNFHFMRMKYNGSTGTSSRGDCGSSERGWRVIVTRGPKITS